MLRRKRGADYNLSDSDDDGGEARRRMKRRQFAKMQKALFADERISKVAENPKTSAFLRTIEDRGSDEEMDFLFPAEKEDAQTTTSSQGADVAVPDSQPERLPAPQRRGGRKKPTTIGDIRASLSDLLEEAVPETSQVIPATASDHSDDDEEVEPDKENLQPEPTTSNPRRRREAVVDRITLKRNSSSSSSTSRTSRLAFAPSSTSGFKVPALLRRATTNSATDSTTASSTSSITGSGTAPSKSGGNGGFGEESKIKRNAGKRSGINYFARENERRAALEEGERRREAKKVRGAEGRSKVVGGLFAGGKFE